MGRGSLVGDRRRLRALLVWILLCVAGEAVAAKPEWAARHGASVDHPPERFVTGYGTARGEGALGRAKREAAADLARKLSVRIETEVSDVSAETDGEYRYRLAAVTRTTTDLRLRNLRYEEPYKRWGRVHVLAFLERGPAARAELAERDRALRVLRDCLAAGAEAKRAERRQAALETFERCRRPVARALRHEAIAGALVPLARESSAHAELSEASRRLDREIESVLSAPASSLPAAADALALRLTRQGVALHGRWVVAPLHYGATNLSSSFGQEAGLELERAIVRAAAERRDVADPWPSHRSDWAVSGVYLESDDHIRLSVTAREIESGRLVASAESTLPRSAVPAGLELRPPNFERVLADQRILRGDASEGSALQVRVFTDKGRGGVVYNEDERIRLYVRVNRPAWVRLVYVLQNGAQVPIDEAFRIGRSEVETDVVYPVDFVVVPPFGVEMVHATAFLERPPPLSLRDRVIAGHRYQVIADGMDSVVRTRGIAARTRQPIAEDTVTVTTTARPR